MLPKDVILQTMSSFDPLCTINNILLLVWYFCPNKNAVFLLGSKFSGFASRQNAVFAESDEEPEEARKK